MRLARTLAQIRELGPLPACRRRLLLGDAKGFRDAETARGHGSRAVRREDRGESVLLPRQTERVIGRGRISGTAPARGSGHGSKRADYRGERVLLSEAV